MMVASGIVHWSSVNLQMPNEEAVLVVAHGLRVTITALLVGKESI